MTRWRHVFLLRLRSLTRRSAIDRELDKELRFHLEEHVAELVASGMPRDQARDEAMREFGSRASITQQCREARRVTFVENLGQDVRYALRTLARQPTLVATAAVSIALGVGANLAIFGLANTLLLSTPTAGDADRLVNIRSARGSHVAYETWRALDDSGAVDGVAGYRLETEVNWRTANASIGVTPLVVSENFFDVMRIPMTMGRGFSAAEAVAERDPRLAVISHAFWTTRLGADRNVLGSTVVLNGNPFTVLGVMPAGSRSLPGLGFSPDLWLPFSPSLAPDFDNPRAGHFQLVGRLHDGQTVHAARAALDIVVASNVSHAARPGEGTLKYVGLVGGLNQLDEFKSFVPFFAVLMLVTWLVLGIACANVAGLLLARSVTRRKEIAMRLAIGASRGRLIQQLLTEGIVLSALGTLGGVALTALVARVLARVDLPLPFAVTIDFAWDARVAAAAAVLVVLSTLFSALTPAFHATRPDVMPSLKQEARSYFHRRFTMRGLLVTGQVAVSVLLLVVTVLFLRNLALAQTVTPGFDADRTLLAQVTFVEGSQGGVANPAVMRIVDRLRSIPGVEAATFAGGVPLTLRYGGTTGTMMRIDGHDAPVRVDYDHNRVGPDYFKVMGIQLLLGREFGPGDRRGAPEVAIVNEEFVRRYFDGRNPVGRAIYFDADPQDIRAEIVGVAANSKYSSIGEDRDAAVYQPYLRSSPDRLTHVLVRTTGSPSLAQPAVRDAIAELDPDVAIVMQPMTTAAGFAFLPSRIGAAIVGALGTLGTLLAMIGLYGVVSFSVTRRTREIGIRMALGSTRRAAASLVFKDGAILVGTGLAIGLGIAYIATRPLSAFLVAQLPPSDPWSFAGTAVILSLTSLLAGWSPARRAMRIQPAETLRAE